MSDDVTRSKDPKLVACRVFIGCLPSERTSREELEEKFAPYGNILGISIHQGFAFVQYDEERNALAAVDAEQGCYFKGKNLDLRVASEGRKPGGGPPGRGGPPMKRPYDDYPPPRRPPGPGFDDPAFHHPRGGGPPGGWERGGGGYGPPDPMLEREGGFRDDPFWRERYGPGGPPPPAAVGPPVVDTFQGDSFPGPPAHQSKRVEFGVERPFDSVIVAVNKHLKMYAEMVERKLIELSMTVDVIFLVHENALLKAIDDMTRRGVLYILIVQPQHEERKSITVNIMHGPPQEHRNMPLDDALMMLARNFKTYLSSLRSGSEQPSMGFLLNLLADGKHLSVAELDRIIGHLQDRRDRMIEAEGGKVVARDIAPAAAHSTAEQLQQRILNILGGAGGGAPGAAAAPPPPAVSSNPSSMLANMAQHFGLNLNPSSAGGNPPPHNQPSKDSMSAIVKPPSTSTFDPNLAKSLDSLLQNPGLLKNLAGGARTTTAGTTGNPDAGKQQQFAGANLMQQPPLPKPGTGVGGGHPSPMMETGGGGGGMRPPHPPPGGHGGMHGSAGY